jgi:ribonuclease BN (tRNA processing enzyme)
LILFPETGAAKTIVKDPMRIKFLKAKHGDCIVVSIRGKNILIDGGAAGCYYDANLNEYGQLRSEIESIRLRKEKIDLLILTHIDNDHICGLLKWFQMDDQASDLILSIWFNSGRVLSHLFNEALNNDLRIAIESSVSPLTGVAEAVDFEDFVSQRKIWDKTIWLSGMKFETPLFRIDVLSPEPEQLKKLVREYKAKLWEQAFTSKKTCDWTVDIKAIVNEERKDDFKFSEDRSVKNGSSIAFILSAEGKRILFLGDAHPSVIVRGLNANGYDKGNPLCVDLIKLSHHGSNANTNSELLSAVRTDCFVVSTNGEFHCHPGKRTLARILAKNATAKIFFNYEEVRDMTFTKNDRTDYQINSFVKTEFEL